MPRRRCRADGAVRRALLRRGLLMLRDLRGAGELGELAGAWPMTMTSESGDGSAAGPIVPIWWPG